MAGNKDVGVIGECEEFHRSKKFGAKQDARNKDSREIN